MIPPWNRMPVITQAFQIFALSRKILRGQAYQGSSRSGAAFLDLLVHADPQLRRQLQWEWFVRFVRQSKACENHLQIAKVRFLQRAWWLLRILVWSTSKSKTFFSKYDLQSWKNRTLKRFMRSVMHSWIQLFLCCIHFLDAELDTQLDVKIAG